MRLCDSSQISLHSKLETKKLYITSIFLLIVRPNNQNTFILLQQQKNLFIQKNTNISRGLFNVQQKPDKLVQPLVNP